MRSAVYGGALPAQRRTVHQALAAVIDPGRDPVRRAWHLGEATVGLDEPVAAELEQAAEHTQGRSTRPCCCPGRRELTPAPGLRTDRSLAAAQAHIMAGDHRRHHRTPPRPDPRPQDSDGGLTVSQCPGEDRLPARVGGSGRPAQRTPAGPARRADRVDVANAASDAGQDVRSPRGVDHGGLPTDSAGQRRPGSRAGTWAGVRRTGTGSPMPGHIRRRRTPRGDGAHASWSRTRRRHPWCGGSSRSGWPGNRSRGR
jgi:hypothetical protein